jgi:hypothetical protein
MVPLATYLARYLNYHSFARNEVRVSCPRHEVSAESKTSQCCPRVEEARARILGEMSYLTVKKDSPKSRMRRNLGIYGSLGAHRTIEVVGRL